MGSEIRISESLSLKHIAIEDAGELFHLVEQNRAYLKQWLPWLDYNTSPADSEKFIKNSLASHLTSGLLTMGIYFEDKFCGMISHHKLDTKTKILSIGYWISQAYQGKGIVTKSCQAMIQYGFDHLGAEIVEIAAATENMASRNVAEKLGATLLRIDKERENLYGTLVDHAIYYIRKIHSSHSRYKF